MFQSAVSTAQVEIFDILIFLSVHEKVCFVLLTESAGFSALSAVFCLRKTVSGMFTEREHGDAKCKPNLDFLLDHMETDSTLIVCEVSRLSRSVLQFCEIMETIKTKHLRLIVIGSIIVDCRNGEMDPMSAAFFRWPVFSANWKRICSVPGYNPAWKTPEKKDGRSAAVLQRKMILILLHLS